jgi:hypothetical protein
MKKFLLITSIVTLVFALPLYAVGKIIVPEWLKSQLILNIPVDAELRIGTVDSSLDLSVTYEDIVYTSKTIVVEIPKLIVSPKISLNAPVTLNAVDISVIHRGHSISAKDVMIKILPKGLKLNDIDFSGSVEFVNDDNYLKIEATKFLISSITSSSFDLEISGKKADIFYNTAPNIITSSFLDFKSVISLNEGLQVDLKSDMTEFAFGNNSLSLNERTFFSKEISANLGLKKNEFWSMPLSLTINDITAPGEISFDSLELNAIGQWNEQSKSCNIQQLFSGIMHCGKMIDVVGLTAELLQPQAQILFSGDGHCVAPRSGCPQKIVSKISSQNTASIFSNIISSGVLNPLVGGVLLGGMLSSPKDQSDMTSHEISLDVYGSRIFINGEPLIK